MAEGDPARLLARRARKLAEEKKIAIEPGAIERLLVRTDGDPRLFASELEKILDWAGEGGKVRAADVEALVEDRRAEDVYAFFDAFGSRDRAETLRRLERVLSGKTLRTGDREIKGDEPLRAFFGMLVAEVRRLLVVRARCDETRTKMNPGLGCPAYQSGSIRVSRAGPAHGGESLRLVQGLTSAPAASRARSSSMPSASAPRRTPR